MQYIPVVDSLKIIIFAILSEKIHADLGCSPGLIGGVLQLEFVTEHYITSLCTCSWCKC